MARCTESILVHLRSLIMQSPLTSIKTFIKQNYLTKTIGGGNETNRFDTSSYTDITTLTKDPYQASPFTYKPQPINNILPQQNSELPPNVRAMLPRSASRSFMSVVITRGAGSGSPGRGRHHAKHPSNGGLPHCLACEGVRGYAR